MDLKVRLSLSKRKISVFEFTHIFLVITEDIG
jgi:hypothetical protein